MNRIVSQEEWLSARKALLAKEKRGSRLRDEINAERLALPWVKIEDSYVFDAPEGKKTLGDLFDGRSQLIVYHFMLAPGWGAGCTGCSYLADHFDGVLPHLQSHDVTLICASRAPLAEILAYESRMGWSFPWVSSHGSSFNYDYGVSFTRDAVESGRASYNYEALEPSAAHEEMPGLSAFARNAAGEIFHTYSCYARGLEDLLSAHMILDRSPKGRNETGPLSWVRRRDEYANVSGSCCES